MSSTNVTTESCSPLDDSSQHNKTAAPNLEGAEMLEHNQKNVTEQESVHLEVSCDKETITNTGEFSKPIENESNGPNVEPLVSEETVPNSEILLISKSPINEPGSSIVKKKRGRKPKPKDSEPKTVKPKAQTKRKNTKKTDKVDKFQTTKPPTTRSKRITKSKPQEEKSSDDATDAEKSNEDDEIKTNELPSVYSRNQIAKHKKRINKLKELEQENDSDSEADTDAALDRDLDINLRIFEESAKSDDKVVGEIQCNFLDNEACTEVVNGASKTAINVFQFTVNSNTIENCDINDPNKNRVSKDNNANIEDIALSDDPMEYSDNDSDFEILVSKPIIRKRAAQPVKKEKPAEKKQKLTMYDLIHDNCPLSPEPKEEISDTDQKEDIKLDGIKKTKTPNKNLKSTKKEEPIEDDKELIQNIEDKSQNLPVPKLKVGADGEVVIDMDSLVIEQTGVSEARSAIANSEVIEECSLSYNTYNKKNNFRKQWTPHETLKFYQVLSTIGTDFTLMATLFPGRTRKCMKRKFKREEKANAGLILKALSCKQNFNINLLEKELQLNDEKVNQLKENSKKRKPAKKTPVTKKEPKCKRKSFFESSIQSFQSGQT